MIIDYRLIILFVEISLISLFCLHLIDGVVKIKKVLLLVLLKIAFMIIINSIPQILFCNALIQVVFWGLILSFVCRVRFNVAFITALIGLSIYLCIEGVSGFILISLEENINITIRDALRNYVILALKIAFFLSAYLFIKRVDLEFINNYRFFVSHFKKDSTNKKVNIGSDYYILSITMFVFYIFSYIISYNCNNTSDQCILYRTMTVTKLPSVISGIILPIVVIFIMKQLIVLIQNKIDSNIHINSLQSVKELINMERTQRHDFNHELQVTYGLLEIGAFDEAREYLKKSVKEISITSNSIKIDNLSIASLIYVKKCISEAKGIELYIDVKSSFKELHIQERDIILILGNLIDNSIEATEILNDKEKKHVQVNLYFEYNCYIIEVLNAGDPLGDELVKKIFTPGFTTKKTGMGMGLYSINRIVKKYSGHIQILNDMGLNCFRVVIPANANII